jgi:hypothetical protein
MGEPVSLDTLGDWKNADHGTLGGLRKLCNVRFNAWCLQANAVHLFPVLSMGATTRQIELFSNVSPEVSVKRVEELRPQGEMAFQESIADRPAKSSIPPGKAVRRLVSFCFLIVLLVFAVNALVGVGLRHIRTSSFGAWNQVMQGRVNADVIISGSSRATYHYDPRVIESATGRTAFNIGRVGSQTDVQVAVLKAYLEHNRKPTLVVHNLDAFTFVTTREIFEPAQYVPYLDDQTLYESLRRFDPNLAKSRYLPLYGYIVEDMNFAWFTGVRALLGRFPKEDYFLGFSPRDKEWSDEFERFKRGNPHGVSFAIEPKGVEALAQLIQLCQQNGIQLVLVYSPEYSEMQTLTNNRIAIFATFKELADRNHVQLWDFSNWMHDGDRDYFYNSQHLNSKGAEAFSDDLAARLKDYLAKSSKQQPGAFQVSISQSPAGRHN